MQCLLFPVGIVSHLPTGCDITRLSRRRVAAPLRGHHIYTRHTTSCASGMCHTSYKVCKSERHGPKLHHLPFTPPLYIFISFHHDTEGERAHTQYYISINIKDEPFQLDCLCEGGHVRHAVRRIAAVTNGNSDRVRQREREREDPKGLIICL